MIRARKKLTLALAALVALALPAFFGGARNSGAAYAQVTPTGNPTLSSRPVTGGREVCVFIRATNVCDPLFTVNATTGNSVPIVRGDMTITPAAGWSPGNTARVNLGDTGNYVGVAFGGRAVLSGFNGVELRYGSGPTAGLTLDAAGLTTVGALATNSGGVNIQPTQNTIAAALTTFQVLGNAAAPPNPWINLEQIASDNINFGATAFFAPWTRSYFFGGSTLTGARTATSLQATMIAASSASNANRQYNTLGVTFFANAADGGTGTTQSTSKGAVGAMNPILIANANAKFMNVIGTVEVDTSIQSGGSAWYKFGLASVLAYSDAVRGAVYDGAFVVGRAADSPTNTWKYGYGFFDVHGLNPLGSDSIAIGSIGTSVIGSFFDFPNYSCGGNIIRINTVFNIDCAGNFTAGHIAASMIDSGTFAAARMPAFSGDATSSAGAAVLTLANVNANVGSFGGASSTVSITVDAKGRVTAVSATAIIAPAGTLSGATLAANVLASSLTSVGILTGGATGAGFTIALSVSTISGTLPTANTAALTGDVTKAAGSNATIVNAAPAGALTGATLAANVLASSLTSVGTLTGGATGAGFTIALSVSTISGTLGAGNGGTGQSSYTIGDILYASAANALSKLADVATGNVLRAGGVGAAPAWGKVNLSTDLDANTIPAANTAALTGDVTKSAGSSATTLATSQPAVHTWALAQTFTVAPVFTDAAGTRTALGLGTAATVNTGTSGATIPLNNGNNTFSGTTALNGAVTINNNLTMDPAAGWSAGNSVQINMGDTSNYFKITNGGAFSITGFNGFVFQYGGTPTTALNLDAAGNVSVANAFKAPSYIVGATAGASCTLTTVSHLTVVGGIVTLCN